MWETRALASAVTSCHEDKMAAQGGIRDIILRVSMPFEKGRHPERKTRAIPARNVRFLVTPPILGRSFAKFIPGLSN
jgi:hypothetical protein